VNANLYAYAGDSPLNNTDPSGHMPMPAALDMSGAGLAPDMTVVPGEEDGLSGGSSLEGNGTTYEPDTETDPRGDPPAEGESYDSETAAQEARDLNSQGENEEVQQAGRQYEDQPTSDQPISDQPTSDQYEQQQQEEEQQQQQQQKRLEHHVQDEHEQYERSEHERFEEEQERKAAAKRAAQRRIDTRDAKANENVGKAKIDKGSTGSYGGNGASETAAKTVEATPDVTTDLDR
jgi:hypothetical protein